MRMKMRLRLLQLQHQKQQQKIRQNLNKLESEIKAYIGPNENKVGLYYYDLGSGKTININGSKEFVAASTVKVPMNMVMLNLVYQGKLSLNGTIQYNRSDYEAGTGILQGQNLSKPILISTLFKDSIVYSDNIATHMIMGKIGTGYMRDCFDKMLGYKESAQATLRLRWNPAPT